MCLVNIHNDVHTLTLMLRVLWSLISIQVVCFLYYCKLQ